MNTQLNELRRLLAEIDSLAGSVEVSGLIRDARDCAVKARSATAKAIKIVTVLDAQKASQRPELWAVHAQGPDDLYAAFNREDAEKHAAELNALPMPEGIEVNAVVVASPWPAAEHWKYLAEQEREHGDATRAARTGQVPQAWLDVQAERRRQVEVEGFDASHDDMATKGQMARAAGCYALHAGGIGTQWPEGIGNGSALFWPWDKEWWKPKPPRENLVRAGAMIIAEIERLDRAAAPAQGGGA